MTDEETERMANLTRRLADTAIDYKQRCEELEAKLAKAVETSFHEGFLAGTADGWINNPRIKMEWKRSRARATLAKLKGQDNE